MILGAVLAAMASDVVTFAIAMQNVTIDQELNPIMAFGYTSFGLPAIVAVKAIGALAMIGLIYRISTPRRRWAAVVIGVGITLAGTTSNIVNGIMA